TQPSAKSLIVNRTVARAEPGDFAEKHLRVFTDREWISIHDCDLCGANDGVEARRDAGCDLNGALGAARFGQATSRELDRNRFTFARGLNVASDELEQARLDDDQNTARNEHARRESCNVRARPPT